MGRAVSVEIPHMIFFFFFVITFFMLMSLHCTCAAHILLSESSSFNAIMEENGGGGGGGVKETMVVRKVSGNDEEKEGKHGIFLENFRILLGLNSFKKRKPQAESMNGSPFSSPTIEAPTPAPAPAPVVPIHVHSHHPLASHHGKLHKQVHKNESKNGNLKVILVAVLVSVAATSIVCVVAIIWYCRRIRINPKRSLEHDIHSSDDDSFHSFCDSHSSFHERLSNASLRGTSIIWDPQRSLLRQCLMFPLPS